MYTFWTNNVYHFPAPCWVTLPLTFCWCNKITILLSEDFENHCNKLDMVQLTEETDRSCNTANAFIWEQFSGYLVLANNINEDKIKALEDWPVPKNSREVRQVLRFLNYHHCFIPRFERLMELLNMLVGKPGKTSNRVAAAPFIWSAEMSKWLWQSKKMPNASVIIPRL